MSTQTTENIDDELSPKPMRSCCLSFGKKYLLIRRSRIDRSKIMIPHRPTSENEREHKRNFRNNAEKALQELLKPGVKATNLLNAHHFNWRVNNARYLLMPGMPQEYNTDTQIALQPNCDLFLLNTHGGMLPLTKAGIGKESVQRRLRPLRIPKVCDGCLPRRTLR